MTSLYDNKPCDYFALQWEEGLTKHLWYKVRQRYIREQVERYHSQGGTILDVGCGNNVWNTRMLPVIGMDQSAAMLGHNRERNPAFFPVVIDLDDGLPIASRSVDLVVITDVLEYITSYFPLIDEIWRVLCDNGIVIVSVPYSKLPGLWPLVFPLWCRWNVWRHKDEFYKARCGHLVTFDKRVIRATFRRFEILRCHSLGLLTIFCICRKRSFPEYLVSQPPGGGQGVQ